MPDPTTAQQLRGLILSATEVTKLTGWPQPMVEDYLTMFENLIKIADLLDVEIDQKLEEVSTDFLDGSIPFVDNGFLVEENPGLTWLSSILGIVGGINVSDNAFVGGDIKGLNRAKQYFFAGF